MTMTNNEFDDPLLKRLFCPICLDVFNEAAHLDTCGHEFCNSCLKQWLSKSQSCPICRKDATIDDIRPCNLYRFVIGIDELRMQLEAMAAPLRNTDEGTSELSRSRRLIHLKETIMLISYCSHLMKIALASDTGDTESMPHPGSEEL